MATKKNPRAPSIPLDEAIAKAVKVYEKERRHAAPTDVVAQNIGYKNANNGAALSTLASLRYFGLLERPKDGHLAATKDLETYLYAPRDEIKTELLHKWMKMPPVFAEILEKYADGLPSDATLRFDMINQGFSPSGAEAVISVFKRSAEFSGIYSGTEHGQSPHSQAQDAIPSSSLERVESFQNKAAEEKSIPVPPLDESGTDRIPIRLPEGRRAWLIIPNPFYESDKERLKAQIDLLLTDD